MNRLNKNADVDVEILAADHSPMLNTPEVVVTSQLTKNPRVAVKVLAADHSLIISTPQAVLIKCTICGGYKDLSVHAEPGHQEAGQDATPHLGTQSYPWMRQCLCAYKRTLETVNAYQLLTDLYTALGKCQTLEDARQLVANLALQEEAKRG